MSEEQFVLYEHKEDYYILKNPRLHLDFIEMLGDALTSEEIVEELNQLNDKVVELAKENEQLREELSECEKFRYSTFKRIEKTIENKKNCAINKDAKYPCKDYDECLKRQGTNKPLPCMVNWVMGRPFENMLRKEGDDE